MEEKPSVSVVMCTYNGAKFIREQIASILQQTYPLHEIIIQDDNSDDETWSILSECAARNPKITIYSNEEKHGVNGNFLSAMKRASGDFIAIADQDDIWETDKIDIQMKAIGKNLLCSGHSRPFSTDDAFAYFDERHRNVNVIRMMFLGLPGHTMLLRRELMEQLPDSSHPIFEYSMYDAALSIIAAAHGRIIYVDKILVNFRRHTAATTYNNYSRNLPTWRNALGSLIWGCRNYRKTRERIHPLFEAKLKLLQNIHTDNADLKEARKIMELETSYSLSAFVRLQYHCIKNSRKLFHTEGKGFVRIVRAALYPVMQLQMYR
ncbi:glycosyltransferase [Prevotella corporis]|uniref:glycosyltransferase n=1 Tax=Prevotella corporis TaxID=28128 RepID=UPI000424F726|nr:glycosyltransferase [Prevotella corporis]